MTSIVLLAPSGLEFLPSVGTTSTGIARGLATLRWACRPARVNRIIMAVMKRNWSPKSMTGIVVTCDPWTLYKKFWLRRGPSATRRLASRPSESCP